MGMCFTVARVKAIFTTDAPMAGGQRILFAKPGFLEPFIGFIATLTGRLHRIFGLPVSMLERRRYRALPLKSKTIPTQGNPSIGAAAGDVSR